MSIKEFVNELSARMHEPNAHVDGIKSDMYLAIQAYELSKRFRNLPMDKLVDELNFRIDKGIIPKFWDEKK